MAGQPRTVFSQQAQVLRLIVEQVSTFCGCRCYSGQCREVALHHSHPQQAAGQLPNIFAHSLVTAVHRVTTQPIVPGLLQATRGHIRIISWCQYVPTRRLHGTFGAGHCVG